MLKKYACRVLAVFMAVVIFGLSCMPGFASSGSQYEQRVGFWGWLSGKDGILPDFVGYMTGTICPKSEDGYHHASTYQSTHKMEGYFNCICTYCGATFIAYESDLQQSYQQQVESLPAPGYNSSGNLIWYPILSFSGHGFYYFNSSSTVSFSDLPVSIGMDSDRGSKFSLNLSSSADSFVCKVFNYGRNGIYVGIEFDAICPVSGSYRRLGGTYCSYSLLLASYGVRLNSTLQRNASDTFVHYDLGHLLRVASIPYGQDLFDSSLYGYGPDVSSGILNLYIVPSSFADRFFGIIDSCPHQAVP